MRKQYQWMMGALLLGFSGHALALGLGPVKVKSGMNERLLAEVPITSATPAELDSLKVTLASPKDFERIKLDHPTALSRTLRVAVVKNAKGQQVIRLTTTNRQSRPIVQLLLDVRWASGRMLREYSLLLDPPRAAMKRTTQTVKAPVAQKAPVRQPTPRPEPKPQVTTQPVDTTPAPEPVSAPSFSVQTNEYGPVGSGENLLSIAKKVSSGGSKADIERMMVAIVNANPKAFIKGNMHMLKKGAVLRIPDQSALDALPRAEVVRTINEQTQNWRQRVKPQAQPQAQEASSTAKKQADSDSSDDSRLELVSASGNNNATSAESGASSDSNGSALRADLVLAKEEIESLKQDKTELESRIQELESINTDSQKLLELRQKELMEAQSRLRNLGEQVDAAESQALEAAQQADAQPAADDEPAADADTTETSLDDQSEETTTLDAESTDTVTEDDSVAVQPTDSDSLDVVAEDTVDAPAVETTSEPEPVVETTETVDLVDAPADDDKLFGLIPKDWLKYFLVLPILLLLGWLLKRFKGGRGKAEVADRPRSSGLADSFGDEAPSDYDDVVSEQSLLEALAREPDNLDRHHDLVMHYYQESNEQGFEAAAEAMYAQVTETQDPQWQQVLAMGAEMIPNHPLFKVEDDPFATPTVPLASGDDFATQAMGAVVPPPVMPDANDDEVLAESALFDGLDELEEDVTQGAEAVSDTVASLDDDIDIGMDAEELLNMDFDAPADTTVNLEPKPLPVLDDEPLVAASTDHGLDFVLPDDTVKAAEDSASNELGFDLGDDDFSINTDIDTPSTEEVVDKVADAGDSLLDSLTGADDDNDAAATKLELARAYIDMGDPEGARGMLEEVLTEGGSSQRSEAQQLLGDIS